MITLNMRYNIKDGLVMSPSDVYETYLYGINTSAEDGSPISDDTMLLYIQAAQEELEKYLDIKMSKGIIEESQDYYRDDNWQWGIVVTDYPVREVLEMTGWFGGVKQITIPEDWATVKKSTNELYEKKIQLVASRIESQIIFGSGIGIPFLNRYIGDYIPAFWRLKYSSGFDKLPMDLVNFIGKMTAMNIFNLLGDLIIGAGIASQSLSIDGLSQSINTTSSAENSGYSSRVKAYIEDLKVSLPRLEKYYKNITFTVA
jgi:hypothetical protein